MESLRLACDRDITLQQQKIDAFIASSRESLLTTRARAQETVQCQGPVPYYNFSLYFMVAETRSVTASKKICSIRGLLVGRCGNQMRNGEIIRVWGIVVLLKCD